MTVLLATGVFALPLGSALAAQATRDDAGPGAVVEPSAPVTPPPATPPASPPTTPPAEPPVEAPPGPPTTPPPSETPPTEAPVEPPPPRPVEAPKKPVAPPPEDDSFDGGFEVTDLTEDEEALKKELEVKTVDVKGAKGTITGKVKDAATGQPMIGAYVEAIGTPYKTKTDLEGNYTLELPPGKYDIRIRYDTSEPRRISGVVVEKDKEQTLSGELVPLAGGSQTVAIKAEMNRESEGARLLQRKESAASRDILSRESITKSGSGSTASVATRIVGATVIDGKYLFVRGLGHRYGNTLFDGARMPSPDPDIRTIPLDIFPSGALSAINVQKTFTPDVPGDFVGGSVQLESREIPKKLLFELVARVGVNTSTTFQPIVHNGGFPGYDAFAFGNLPRRLPGSFPTDAKVDKTTPNPDGPGNLYTPQQIENFGESMYTDTRVRRGRIGAPNGNATATVGYGFSPHDNGKLGFVLSANYRTVRQNYQEKWRFYAVDPTDGEGVAELPKTQLQGLRSIANVQWSTIAIVKYEANKRNKLSGLAFYSRDADNETRDYEGSTESGPLRSTRLRYVMRSVLLTRLGGVHEIAAAKNLKIDWFGSFAQARRDDPSIRDMDYQNDPADPSSPWLLSGNGAGQQFLSLKDNTESGALNFTMPFKQWRQLDGKVKIGAWIEGKQRNFSVRRFDFATATGLNAPPGTGNIIINNSIGGGISSNQGGTEPFYVRETTQDFDSYRAHQEVYATYAMLELPIVRWFKLTGGARFEANRQFVGPYNIFGNEVDNEQSTRIEDNEVLPAVALIFPTTDKMNVRVSATQTVARPEFREVAPFLFTDFVGGISLLGTPGLKSAKVTNGDIRWEWFPSAEEVIAVSVFGKYFQDPIERTVLAGTGSFIVNFRNAKLAYNFGAEFEARKNLEFIAKKMRDFSVGLNFAYVYSRVQLAENCNINEPGCDPEDTVDSSTSRVRPLQGQSPFVANAFLDYDNKRSGTGIRLLYNTVLRNIALVGGNGLPDIYAEAIHQLDFVGRQRIYKNLNALLQVGNMLNWPIRWTQGPEKRLNYKMYPGANIMVGISYSL